MAFFAKTCQLNDGLLVSSQVALGSREEEVCVDAAVDEGGSAEVDVLRGYGHPSAHNLTAVAEASVGGCNRTALRRIGSDLVPQDVEVGAIRVSVTGWEGWVMEGLAVSLQLCSAKVSHLASCGL